MDSNNQIIIYQTEDGQTQVDVRMENDMIWLTRQQIATLFGRDYKTISKHINTALKEELAGSVVVAKFANTTQHGAIEGKTQTHEIDYFNLEVITSVGYRVKSKRGVQFRQWANKVLKQYLIKGYAINERLRKEQISELRQLVGMLGRTIQNQPLLSNDETNALFDVVVDYTYALDTLDDYDYQRLMVKETTQEDKFHATYDNAMETIKVLRDKFGGSTLFGLADEFVDGRIFIDVGLLAVVDSHGSMGRFCPGKKGKLLVRQGKVLGDKGKTCPGQGKIVGFTGGSTDNVVQFVIDGDNVMSPGKYML